MGSTFWAYFKYYLPYETPFLLIWIAGLMLSIHSRQQNRKKFRLASLAFTVFLVGSIGSMFASSVFYEIVSTSGKNITETTYRLLYWIPYWVPILTNVTAWAILLNAVFNRKINAVNGN